MVLDIIK